MNAAPLWTAEAAARATGGASFGRWQASGVSIDSRTVNPGDLFIALIGERMDGHDYVKAVLDKGASAAMVQNTATSLPAATAPLLVVPDTMVGLENLARAARARSSAKIAAVTGSVGKTGTKDALALVLSRQGSTAASAGNLNNHIGVPLSLARLPEAVEFAIFELGMNHAGEISPLSQLVKPDAAIITTVTPAHLEFFADEAAIADEKAAIMDGLPIDGAIVLNRDNSHFDRLHAHAVARGLRRIFTFGAHPDSSVRMVAGNFGAEGSRIVAAIAGQTIGYQLGVPGRHTALNSLGVLAMVAALGGDVDQAASDLADLTPPKGRGQPFMLDLPNGTITLIDDSYNASPAAVGAAMSTLATMNPAGSGRRIAVLGDMLELGTTGPKLHASLLETILENGIDLVFTAGPLMRHLHDALPADLQGVHAEQAADLLEPLLIELHAGDIVTIKGSLGSRMSALVAALREQAEGKAT